MPRIIAYLAVAILVGGIFPLAAQGGGPDYSIRNIRSRLSDNGQQAIVEFEVWNIGAKATDASVATLNVIATGEEVASDPVPPLEAQEIHTVTLTFATNQFEPGSAESFRAAVGIDEVEASGSPNIQDNFAQITITFPETLPLPEATSDAGNQPSGVTAQPDILSQFMKSLGHLDYSDPAQIPILAAIVGAAVLLLLILILIVRLIFYRPPEFGNWQPPYASMLPLDPNTLPGRRQQWQLHAQNSSLPATATSEGQLHVRKLPTDFNEDYLSTWHITAIRMSQYDMYGRVHRSQTIAPRGTVKSLDKVAQKRSRFSAEQIEKKLRPIAKTLAAKSGTKLNERNAMLPLALDIRLSGKHGDVHIWFELFRSEYGQWVRLDRWEPEMTVVGKIIYESFTYTIHGLRPGENMKGYRQRLQDELVHILVEMLFPVMTASPAQRSQTPTDPHLKAVNPAS
jgi:hypothetical protein